MTGDHQDAGLHWGGAHPDQRVHQPTSPVGLPVKGSMMITHSLATGTRRRLSRIAVTAALAAVPLAAVTAPAFAATTTPAQVQVDRGWHDGTHHDNQRENWQDTGPWSPQTDNQTPAPTTNPFAGLLETNPFAGLFGSS